MTPNTWLQADLLSNKTPLLLSLFSKQNISNKLKKLHSKVSETHWQVAWKVIYGHQLLTITTNGVISLVDESAYSDQ